MHKHFIFAIGIADTVDEMGSRSSLSRDDNSETDHWEMNYHEAAIFLEVRTCYCFFFLNQIIYISKYTIIIFNLSQLKFIIVQIQIIIGFMLILFTIFYLKIINQQSGIWDGT